MTQKLKPLRPYIALPLILLVAFGLVSIARPPATQSVTGNYGQFDLRDFDFENYRAYLWGGAKYVPNALLSPAEFEAWEGETFFGWALNYTTATSRMRVYVEDGKWYTFSRNSIDYSHRIYVNGNWLLDIGRPGETPETDIPNTGRITFTAQGIDGVIEIIQQSSNHVHRSGGFHPAWSVGTGTTISDMVRAEQYQTNIILGSFFILSLLFFVLYFTHAQNISALYFALFCLTWFMRMGVTGGRVFTVIFPWMDWFTKFRIEYIAIPVSAVLTLAIVNVLFKDVLHKVVLYAMYGVSAVFVVLFLFLPTITMRDVLDFVYIVYGLGIVWMVGSFIVARRKIVNTEQGIFLFGLAVFFISALTDFGYFTTFIYMPLFHLTGVAMLIFALCEADAVFISTMKSKQILTAENTALASVARMKTEFLANMSHEIKTPLTIISGHVQLAAMLLKKMEIENAEIDTSLHKAKDEIMRLARLTENSLWIASMQESRERMQNLNTTRLIKSSAEMHRQTIERRNNTLTVNVPDMLPQIFGSADQIIQVITNLLTNAAAHTQNGEIDVTCELKASDIVVTISDSGTGISPSLLPHVFERGVTGGEGTGLGLVICRDIIEAHGGKIKIESTIGKGTAVTFQLGIRR